MIEDLLSAVVAIATPGNFLILFLGIWAGCIIGAIPGMTGTMAVTLALPFTFYLEPVPSILLLVALYKGATFGGSISAILINTPGTASAACTALDGYPLAKRGEAMRALDTALYTSVAGDFVSNLSLIVLAVPLALLALHIGPPEYFMLMLFALTTVAGVSGVSLLAGLISAALGLLLATVGTDLYGSYRFDVVPEMQAGLAVAPVLIGLFALPGLLTLIANRKSSGASVQALDAKGDKVTWAELKGQWFTVLRGSSIGVVFGAIPGLGPATAAFFSYGEAQRVSRNRDKFGTGEIEGIAAAESANSGATGSTMIPLLALGVPGDVITGIMLGAFLIQGLTPGPLLFQTNIHEIYMLFIGIMVSSIFLLVAGRLTTRVFRYLVRIPASLLSPGVLVLCIFGIFAIASNTFDVTVLLVLGAVGFFMALSGLPAAPFLIAFILGPLVEQNLRRSLAMSRGELDVLLSSPICWIFATLTIVVVTVTFSRSLRKGAKA